MLSSMSFSLSQMHQANILLTQPRSQNQQLITSQIGQQVTQMAIIFYYSTILSFQAQFLQVGNYENVHKVTQSIQQGNDYGILKLHIWMVEGLWIHLGYWLIYPEQNKQEFCSGLVILQMTFIYIYQDYNIEIIISNFYQTSVLQYISIVQCQTYNKYFLFRLAQHMSGHQNNTILSGCYVRNSKKIDQTYKKITIPLQHIDYKVDIVNGLVNIMMNQIYFNPEEASVEIDYFIPVLSDTYIYKIEVTLNGTTTAKPIQQIGVYSIAGNDSDTNQESVKNYQSRRSNQKDCMKFQVGTIPAKSGFFVNVSMVQEMKVSMNNYYRFQLPDWILPKHREVSNLLQKQKSLQDIIFKKGIQKNFQLNLYTTHKITHYHSLSHQLKLQHFGKTKIKLNLSHPIKHNRDFIFQYTTQKHHLPSYAIGTNGNSSTIMLSFIPKFCNQKVYAERSPKSLAISQQYDKSLSVVMGEYVLLVDGNTLSSQNKQRLTEIKQAIILFVKSLPQDSYFNIVYTNYTNGTGEKILYKSQKNKPHNVIKAISQIQKFHLFVENVSIQSLLKDVLEQPIIQGYARHVYLLTNQTMENQQIYKLIKKSTKYCRVHTIGIGAPCHFIKKCAQLGKGKSIAISDTENISQKMVQLLEKTLSPFVTKVYSHFAQSNGKINNIVPNIKSTPYIMKGQAVNFYITFDGVFKKKQVIHLGYADPITKQSCTTKIQIDPQMDSKVNNMFFVNKMAHFKVMQALENSFNNKIDLKQSMEYKEVKDYLQQAIQYSTKYQIQSQFTHRQKTCQRKKLEAKERQTQKNILLRQSLRKQNKKDDSQKHQAPNIIQNHTTTNYSQRNLEQLNKCIQTNDMPLFKAQKKKNQQQLIQSIIRQQDPNGSWNSINLVAEIKSDYLSVIEKQVEKDLVITQIIVNWLQNNQTSSKKYSLVIKKALIWISKFTAQKSISEQKIKKILQI